MPTDTPDSHATGFATENLNPLRYDGLTFDPYEVPAIMNAMMPNGVRVLDVGCGTGAATVVANTNRTNDVMGIEPDPDRAAAARVRGLNVMCGYLDSAFLQQHGSFDVIIFGDVLEHIPDPSRVVSVALEGLNPDGYLLISVPNVAHWTVRWQLLFGNFDYNTSGIRDATHLRWFTRKTLENFLKSLGMEVTEFRNSSGFYTPDYDIFPWNRMPSKLRGKIIHAGTRWFPLLFGCQHVVKARRAKR